MNRVNVSAVAGTVEISRDSIAWLLIINATVKRRSASCLRYTHQAGGFFNRYFWNVLPTTSLRNRTNHFQVKVAELKRCMIENIAIVKRLVFCSDDLLCCIHAKRVTTSYRRLFDCSISPTAVFNCGDGGVQFAASKLFSLLRRYCSFRAAEVFSLVRHIQIHRYPPAVERTGLLPF